jgi:hypothetical protein
MKKIIIALFVLFVSVGVANSQYLNCSTYTSNTEDSIAVSSSTDAESDWFMTKGGFKSIWVEIYNGTFWYTYEIAYPVNIPARFKVAMEGSDTTLTVQGYIGAQSIVLPLKSQSNTSYSVNTLDIGATTRYRIRFRYY